MKAQKSNIIFYCIISMAIHSLIVFLIGGQKEYAFLPKNKPNVVTIELSALPPPEETKQPSDDQALTEQANQQENEQDEPIQQQAVALPHRVQPSNSEQPTPAPSPAPSSTSAPQPSLTAAPILRQSPKQSSRRNDSDTKPLQEQPSSAIPSTIEKGSSSEGKQDQERSNNVRQGTTTGQQQLQQASTTTAMDTSKAEDTSKIKPRRVVECLSCPKPRYPKRALRRGIEGEPRVLITINSNGRVQNVQLERSSGNPEIDNAALDAGRRSRFKAIDGGARVPVSYSIVIKGSDKHQKAIEKQEKQRYTLPAQVDMQNQSTTTSAE